MTVAVPDGLLWWRERPAGAAWLERLPGLVDECAVAWSLHVRAPFGRATVSFVAPAVLADGTQAVLKVNFPDAESEHEPDALTAWGGRGAVRLLLADRERRALLLERCLPGTQLWAVANEEHASVAAAAVLRALWRPPAAGHPFRTLAGEARRWADELPERWERHGGPVERSVVDDAVGWTGELLDSTAAADSVVLHQDLHGGNVLRAERAFREPTAGWLAIDPKPLAGERAFDAASLLRDRRPELAAEPRPVARMRRRLDRLAEALEVDRERMRRWAVIHALAWGMDEQRWFPDIVACAAWLHRA